MGKQDFDTTLNKCVPVALASPGEEGEEKRTGGEAGQCVISGVSGRGGEEVQCDREVTIAEAANDLAFISTGMYGHALAKQDGAPIRMTLPWKYGFKSGKAFVKVAFVEKRPDTMWAQIAPDEYGFWANVNPAVPHPRWSQASERVLGSDERVPTQIYNGYGDYVASLYAGMKGEKLFM